jgi:hypothetical protein
VFLVTFFQCRRGIGVTPVGALLAVVSCLACGHHAAPGQTAAGAVDGRTRHIDIASTATLVEDDTFHESATVKLSGDLAEVLDKVRREAGPDAAVSFAERMLRGLLTSRRATSRMGRASWSPARC